MQICFKSKKKEVEFGKSFEDFQKYLNETSVF